MPHVPSNKSVDVPEVLANKEARVQRQNILREKYPGSTLISFTVNMPGPIKDSHLTQTIFSAGMDAIQTNLAKTNWIPSACKCVYHTTGPESLFVIAAPGNEVKLRMISIEDMHALGRFFDIDVLSNSGAHISRTDLGASPRKCMLCACLAAECARSRAHSIPELLTTITERVTAWQNSHP